MAQQEGGWPLGLQPLNVRVGLVRSFDSYGSISFSTLLSGSPTASSVASSSSDFDSESTLSFFHDRNVTLGTLIGVTGILDLPSGSLRGRPPAQLRARGGRTGSNNNSKGRAWLFSLCARARDVDRNATRDAPPSLGHFLEEERRANGGNNRRRRSNGSTAAAAAATPIAYELDVLADAHSVREANTLFLDGRVAPPQLHGVDGGAQTCRGHAAGPGIPLRLLCLRGS